MDVFDRIGGGDIFDRVSVPKKKQGFAARLLSMPQEALGEAQTIDPETAKATGEAALTLGTGAVSWIPAGLSMFSTDLRSPTERAKTAKEIQESLTYEPRTEAGAKLARTAAYPLEWMAEKGEESGQIWDEKGYPALGAISRFGGEAAPFLVPSLVKGAKAGGKLVKNAADFRSLEGVLDPTGTPTLRPGAIPAEVMPTRGVLVGEPRGEAVSRSPVKTIPEPQRLPAPDERLALPEGQGFTFRDPLEVKDYFDDLRAQVGEMKISPAEKRAYEKKIEDARNAEIEKFQTEQINEPFRTETEVDPAYKTADIFDKITAKEIPPEVVKAEAAAPAKPPKTDVGSAMQDALSETPVYLAEMEIKRQGGLNYDGLVKVYGKDRVKNMVKERPGLVSKEGGAMYDRIADEHGFESPDALIRAIMEKPSKKALAKETKEQFDQVHGEDIALAKKGFTKTPEGVVAGDLNKGDKIFMNDDTFTAKGHDAKGNIILEDGKTIKADAFEKLKADGVKRKLPVEKPAESATIPPVTSKPGTANIPPETTPKAVGEIIQGTSADFKREQAVWKKRVQSGKMSVEEFGKRLTSFNVVDEPTLRGARTQGIAKIVDALDNTDLQISDAVVKLKKMDVSDRIKAAIADYEKAIEVDRSEYGMRSGLPEQAENKLMSALKRELPNPSRPPEVGGQTAKPIPKGDIQTDIPGMSEAETFGLTNPETEIGVLKPKENLSKTGDMFSESGKIPVETDAATRQEIKNSIAEGEEILQSGKSVTGRKMSKEELGAVQRAVDKNKAQLGTTLTSGIDPTQIGPVLKSLKEKAADTMVGKAARGLGQEIHSPEVVLSREPAGKRIYETADRADVAKNSFLSKEGKEFETRMKESAVKPDTEASARVGQALDGKIDPSALAPGERKAFDFFKQKFHFLIQEAGKAAAGDQATYVQALNLANRKVKPMEQVQDLSAGQRNHYKGLKTPEEKIAYLHEKWKENQPETLVKSYDILSRELKNYLPHIFDKETLVDMFKTEAADVANKLRTATSQQSITQFKTRLGELEAAIQTVQGGGFVKYESLPRNVRFKFFENRKGKEGYSFDAAKAYQTYLVGIARKMFDEPAMKSMAMEYENLSPELKPYADWYMRRFSGTLKKNRPVDDFANAVASFQWIRTLGFNPRSAMANLSQRLNTIAEVGLKYSAKGERFAFTEKGKALFDETGLAKEVPQVLYEGGAPSMEKLRSVAGYMFNKVELGNRRHAFLSAYLEAIEKRKMAPEAAVKYAENIVHKTQFRYGRVGMPKIMSSPAGRVGLQFMSYPIKQIELLTDWAKHDPMKLVKYLAMAEGINYTLQEFLDTDMSNAIGIGMNMGEALNVLKDASKGDLREAWRHARLALQPGSGLLPSGFGPTVTGAGKVISAIPEGKAGATLINELTPVMAKRGIQAVQAVKGEQGGKYPILSASGRPSAKLTAGQLIQRTIGPRTETEHKASLDYERRTGLEKQRQQIQREIIDKFLNGDVAGARKLAQESKIVPTMKQIEDEKLKRRFTREEIGKSKGHLTKPQTYQLHKQGERYF
jgi:hypothetical protein